MRPAIATLLLAMVTFTMVPPVAADDQKDLVDQARITFDAFLADSNMSWFRDHVKDAKGIFIVPQFLKAAFFFGGAGGSGVLLAKDEKTGEWSEPAFYTMGAASFGFQFGAQAAEVVLLILTKRGVDSILVGNFKVGADASVAVGPVGAGVEGATTPNLSVDLLTFVRAKGLFAGIALDGAGLASRDEWNKDYYGKAMDAKQIVQGREVSSPHSSALREALTKATAAKEK
jgi:lipid-binding SYLF domain-containing protein